MNTPTNPTNSENPELRLEQLLDDFFRLSMLETQSRINEDDQTAVTHIADKIALILKQISIVDQFHNALDAQGVNIKVQNFIEAGAAFKRDRVLIELFEIIEKGNFSMAQIRHKLLTRLDWNKIEYALHGISVNKDSDVPFLFVEDIEELERVYPSKNIASMPYSLNLMHQFFRVRRFDMVESLGTAGYKEGKEFPFFCWLLACSQEKRHMLSEAQMNYDRAYSLLTEYQSELENKGQESQSNNLNDIRYVFEVSLREMRKKIGLGIEARDCFFNSRHYPGYDQIISDLRHHQFGMEKEREQEQMILDRIDHFFGFIRAQIPLQEPAIQPSEPSRSVPSSLSALPPITRESLQIRKRVSELMNGMLFPYLPGSIEHILFDEFSQTDDGKALNAIKACINLYQTSEKQSAKKMLLEKLAYHNLSFIQVYIAKNMDELMRQHPADFGNEAKMLMWMKKMGNAGRYDLVKEIAGLPIFEHCDLPIFFWFKARAYEECGNKAEALLLYRKALPAIQGLSQSFMQHVYAYDVRRLEFFMTAGTVKF